MAKQKDTAAMDHIVESLKKDKTASYADIKAAADKKGVKGVYPIMFGRAQAMLGIVKSAKRGEGKFARASAAKRAGKAAPAPAAAATAPAPAFGAPVKRGPGRPRKNPLPTSSSSSSIAFDGIIAAVQQVQRDVSVYRATLERVHAMLTEALS